MADSGDPSGLLAMAHRVLLDVGADGLAPHTRKDAHALAEFIVDLFDAPRGGEIAVVDAEEDDGSPALIIEDTRPEKYDSIVVSFDSARGLAAEILEAYHRATEEQ